MKIYRLLLSSGEMECLYLLLVPLLTNTKASSKAFNLSFFKD